MTMQEYESVGRALNKAENDDTPFAIATEDELVVVGDVNKTQVKTHDFDIAFRVPQEQEDGSVKYAVIDKKFKNVYITPRQDTKIIKALTVLIAYYRHAVKNEIGELTISDLTDEHKVEIVTNMDDDVMDAMYDVVAAVLGIDKELKDYMQLHSVITATVQILTNFTEAVNEADTFFG